MIKKEIYSYGRGLDIDSAPSKRGKDVYSMLKNGRITSSYSSGQANNIGSDGLIRCADGNELVFAFGGITAVSDGISNNIISVSYVINHGGANNTYTKTFVGSNADLTTIGVSGGNNSIVATYSDGPDSYLLTTSTNGIDCIWKYRQVAVGASNPSLIYLNNLGWSTDYNYDIVVNHESESVKRMYIADGMHQVFSINLLSDNTLAGNIMSKPKKVFYMVPSYDFSQPVVTAQSVGGSYTSGYVQYAYNLFNISGGQTNMSPLSEMQVMSRYNGGGDVNEIVGKSNIIQIDNIDPGYDYIRIYAIKYSDLNVTPMVSIIGDYAIHNATSLTTTDDGRIQYTSSVEQLQFLGGTELIPRCIIGKKNRLIIANIKEDPWDLNNGLAVDNTNFFDSRCYSVTSGGTVVTVYDDAVPTILDATARAYTTTGVQLPVTHDAYQDKATVLYHPGYNTTPGGEGRHLSYKIKQTAITTFAGLGYNSATTRHMKSGEIYRWAIQFYNNKSQKSTPQWIADVKVPSSMHGMDNSTRVTIEFEISLEGWTRLTAQGVIGYKFLRVERTDSDKSIVAQGIVTPMIFQVTGVTAKQASRQAYGSMYADSAIKVPSPWTRHLQDQVDLAAQTYGGKARPAIKINAMANYGCISLPNMNDQGDEQNAPWAEIYRDSDAAPAGAAWLHWSYQDNRLMQLYSPETIFTQPQLSGGMKARIVGTLRQSARKAHGKLVYTDSADVYTEESSTTTTNLFSVALFNQNNGYLNANGYIGPNRPTYDLNRKTEQLIENYREYEFNRSISATAITILDSPQLAKHDTVLRTYRGLNNKTYKYQNTLQGIIADGRIEDQDADQSGAWDIPIFGVDAIATQNITFLDSSERAYETIAATALGSIQTNDNVLLMEIYRDQVDQYGGYKYEDRTLNKYIEVGRYNTLTTSTYNIIDNGDTFIGNFTFARIARIPGVNFSEQRMQYTEMVKFPVETSVNLANRSDNSYAGWGAQFLPTNDDFHKYNNVFSQEGNVLHSIPDPYLFTKNTHFNNRILASKPKTSGETIDSWLDILPNEELYMEGEYGAINRLLKLNDNLYCFQRDGVAVVSVLPRVQVQGSDSIGIELGVGQALSTYQYLNTQSGCDNFNGVISTSSSVYYADAIRRSINVISPSGLSGLSDKLFVSTYIKGFETTYTNKPRYTLGFDPITDDVLFAIQAGYNSTKPDSEVLMYSENAGRFTGIYEFSPEFLFTVDGKLHSVPTSDRSKLYTHFTNSNSCSFYGVTKPLQLTICLNPEGGVNDNIFNTVEWTHDVYNTTAVGTRYDENISSFTAWNDYLTSDAANISDIRRRFRISRIHIPRSNYDHISRMRGQHLFIKLTYTPSATNKSIIINDLTLMYNAQRG